MHLGDVPSQGHYISLVRHDEHSPEWWLYNDAEISKSALKTSAISKTYLCLYELANDLEREANALPMQAGVDEPEGRSSSSSSHSEASWIHDSEDDDSGSETSTSASSDDVTARSPSPEARHAGSRTKSAVLGDKRGNEKTVKRSNLQ